MYSRCDNSSVSYFLSIFPSLNFSAHTHTNSGQLQYHALAACCLYKGGGHPFGTRVLMSAFSPITCHASDTEITCLCSDTTHRYDLDQLSCIPSCAAGEEWVSQNNSSRILSLSGSCEPCLRGKFSTGLSFDDRCEDVPAGTYGTGSDAPKDCPENTFSSLGAVVCLTCPGGKSSDARSESCKTCDFFFLLSRHCEFPIMGLVVGLAITIVIVILVILFEKYRRRKQRVEERLRFDLHRQRQLVKAKQTDIKLLSNAWKLSSDEVTLETKLAGGAEGDVWKGALRNNYVVAVKIMKQRRKSSASHRHKKSMSRSGGGSSSRSQSSSSSSVFTDKEVRFLIRTRHERLVMFLGCGVGDNGSFIVLEYMDGGSLDRVLWTSSSNSSSMSWIQRFQILLDVADGLAYLHLIHKSVHRDLKSPNILLEIDHHHHSNHSDDNDGQGSGSSSSPQLIRFRAKLADFGMSRIFLKDKKRTQQTSEIKESSLKAIHAANWTTKSRRAFIGTIRWMAPEMMHEKSPQTSPSCDIFSFGVVMWEMLNCEQPWNAISSANEIVKQVRDHGARLKSRVDISPPSGYQDLMKKCWNQDPSHRPLIDVVRKTIHKQLVLIADDYKTGDTCSRITSVDITDSDSLGDGIEMTNMILSQKEEDS